MPRRTTIRLRNTTDTELRQVGATTRAGGWGHTAPSATVPAGATVVFANAARGRFGSAAGHVVYEVPGGTLRIDWSNPFVGRNSYRIETDSTRIGCMCDGDDDAADAVVTFTVMPATRVSVRGFSPVRNGFRFTNSWSGEPLKRVDLKLASIPIGRASNGLCGGMAFAVRDWFEAGMDIPSDKVAPADGSVLRSYIVERLIDSFDLPGGVVPYATMMSSRYPVHDGDLLGSIAGLTSRAAVLARRTWPDVQSHIHRGRLCPLGLVMVESDAPEDLGRHHQVLAYAYRLRGTQVTLWVYDPNSPADNAVTISYDTARTDRRIAVEHRVDVAGPLICAFVPSYVAKMPPSVA